MIRLFLFLFIFSCSSVDRVPDFDLALLSGYDLEPLAPEEKLNIGISYQIEKETTIEELKTIQSRINSELNLVKKLNKSVEISFISKHLPNIEKFSDFRWESNFSLRLKLSSHFLLSLTATYNYDSVPAENIPESDYQLINSVSYTF